MNKLTLLFKIRNNLLCIKENGYLERADSYTRDGYLVKNVYMTLIKKSANGKVLSVTVKKIVSSVKTNACYKSHTKPD